MSHVFNDYLNGSFIRALLLPFCLISFESSAADLTLSGFYQGRNLFVQNPLCADKKNFCTEFVYVNDQKVMSDIRSSAFEIDLSGFEIEDAIKIRITHRDDCVPKILNPQVIRSGAAFQFVSFTVTQQAINWTTANEHPNSMYFVEQFVNNNWIPIKTLYSQADSKNGVYSITPRHTVGTNKYRIKAQDRDGKLFYTREVVFKAAEESVSFYPKSVTDKITLSREVPYEVLSANGQVIRKGKGKEIPLHDIKTGVYYLNIDHRTEKFFKK